jgi:hypothetical protein
MRILKNQSNQIIFFVNASFFSSNDILIIEFLNLKQNFLYVLTHGIK